MPTSNNNQSTSSIMIQIKNATQTLFTSSGRTFRTGVVARPEMRAVSIAAGPVTGGSAFIQPVSAGTGRYEAPAGRATINMSTNQYSHFVLNNSDASRSGSVYSTNDFQVTSNSAAKQNAYATAAGWSQPSGPSQNAKYYQAAMASNVSGLYGPPSPLVSRANSPGTETRPRFSRDIKMSAAAADETAMVAQDQPSQDEKPTKYAWFVLWTIFAVRAIH